MIVSNVSQKCRLCASLIALLLVPLLSETLNAQQSETRRKTFVGPFDVNYSYPIPEGKIGQRDIVAMTEIKEAAAVTALPERGCVEVQGLFTSRPGRTERQFSASVAIESNHRFRLDVQKPDGVFSIRLTNNNGQVKQETGKIDSLDEIDFGEPLAMPWQLLEITNRRDSAVIDDGIITVDGYRMHKITVTIFQPQIGGPVAAAFYFDPSNHLLQKCALINHGAANRYLQYLLVLTYGDYRTEQGVLTPHEFWETVNGQLIMRLNVTSANLTSRHDDSYFTF